MGSSFDRMYGYSGVTVGAVAGTGQPVMSFDAAVMSGVAMNSAHSGMGSVTVTGLQFGMGETYITLHLEVLSVQSPECRDCDTSPNRICTSSARSSATLGP